jgi:hypothetical protein
MSACDVSRGKSELGLLIEFFEISQRRTFERVSGLTSEDSHDPHFCLNDFEEKVSSFAAISSSLTSGSQNPIPPGGSFCPYWNPE